MARREDRFVVGDGVESIILQFHFPNHFGKILIVSMLRDEHLSVLSFLKSYRKLYKPHRMKPLSTI